MAYIRVKKSDSAYTDIPLTTEKPISSSVEVYSGGQFYYNPLVYAGDSIDSGVRVRCNGSNRALATQIYDPVTHDTSGASWSAVGSPQITTRGVVYLPLGTYLYRTPYIKLDASSFFTVEFYFILDSIPATSQGIFAIVASTSLYWNFGVDSQKKFYTTLNKTKWLTFGAANTDRCHMKYTYDNGTFYFDVDDTTKTVSKNLNSAAANYQILIGANSFPEQIGATSKGATFYGIDYSYTDANGVNGSGCLRFGNL